MSYTIEIKQTVKRSVKYLVANCGVRYWEDAIVNGEGDEDGKLIPLRVGDDWVPTIDLDTGIIQNWPEGTIADIHYKVCDAGEYMLLDEDHALVAKIDGYVPSMMSPGGSGYGDYVIMTVTGAGEIQDWQVDLSPFEDTSP